MSASFGGQSGFGPDSFYPIQSLQPEPDGLKRDLFSEQHSARKRWSDFKVLLRQVPAYPSCTRTPRVTEDRTVPLRKEVVASSASYAWQHVVPKDPRPGETRRTVYGDTRGYDFSGFKENANLMYSGHEYQDDGRFVMAGSGSGSGGIRRRLESAAEKAIRLVDRPINALGL
jgi:hypothetical protein